MQYYSFLPNDHRLNVASVVENLYQGGLSVFGLFSHKMTTAKDLDLLVRDGKYMTFNDVVAVMESTIMRLTRNEERPILSRDEPVVYRDLFARISYSFALESTRFKLMFVTDPYGANPFRNALKIERPR